jgi:hypothetical protein
MPVTYSSDHDWEKHTTFDIENPFGTNSKNYEVNNCCTISAIHVSSNDDVFTTERTPEDSYFVELAPTMIVKNDYVHVGSINSFMHVAHDKNVLCDICIVNSIHDATESYYERGKHGLRDLNNIKFPLFLLEFLKLHLFCLPMLIALGFHDLSLYKNLFHRKWFRFKFVSYFLFDALSCFKFFLVLM